MEMDKKINHQKRGHQAATYQGLFSANI